MLLKNIAEYIIYGCARLLTPTKAQLTNAPIGKNNITFLIFYYQGTRTIIVNSYSHARSKWVLAIRTSEPKLPKNI